MPAINKNYIIDEDNDILNITDGALDTYIASAGVVASNTGKAIVMTTFSDDYGNQGKRFICNDIDTIASEGVVTYLFNLSNVAEGDKVYLLPLQATSDSEEVLMTLYEDTDYAGGTESCLINTNRVINTTPNMVVTKGATGTSKGNQLTQHILFGSIGPGQVLNPASTGGSSAPMQLDTNKNYIIELENIGTGTTKVEHDFIFFEF